MINLSNYWRKKLNHILGSLFILCPLLQFFPFAVILKSMWSPVDAHSIYFSPQFLIFCLSPKVLPGSLTLSCLAILPLSTSYLTVQQNQLEEGCSLCWLQLFSPPALNAVGSQSQIELKPSSAIYAATSCRFLTRDFLDQNTFLSRPDFWSCIGNQIKAFWPELLAQF